MPDTAKTSARCRQEGPSAAQLTPGGDERPRPLRTAALVCLAAATAGIVVVVGYGPVLLAQAAWFDDHQYVLKNEFVQHPTWVSAARVIREVRKPSSVRGYYQPVTMLSLMLDAALSGRPSELRVFRRTNLLLHLVNTALVIILLGILFKNAWVAGAVGLVFGVHPMTVEPVAWVAERKTLLATLFALACLVAYVGYVRRPHWSRYGLCVALMVLALLAKPIATPLPALLLLLDYWPLRRLSRRAVMEKLPLLALAGVSAAVTVVSQGAAAGMRWPDAAGLASMPLVACYNTVFYLYRLVWPANLALQYPFPEPLDFSNHLIRTGVAGTILLLAFVLVSWRWTRAAVVGTAFFLTALAPVLVPSAFTFVVAADKFVYLPMLGALLPLSAAAVWIGQRGSAVRRAMRVVGTLVVVVVAVGEVWLTRGYLTNWQDTDRLHRTALAQTPGAYSVRYNLGLYLEERGRLEEALAEFDWVVLQQPEHAPSYSGLGRVCAKLGRIDEAVFHYREALLVQPDSFEDHFNLANVLLQQKETETAVAEFEKAVQLRPDRFDAYLNLGNALYAQGKLAEALAQYDEALRRRPNYARLHYNRGLALAKLGRIEDAGAEFRRTLELDPNHALARAQLEALLSQHEHGAEPAP